LGPGTYQVRINAVGKPSLFDGETPLDDPTFETTGTTAIKFEIEDPTGILDFTLIPITWRGLAADINPPDNVPVLDGKRLTLEVNVGPGQPERTLVFTLHFNRGDIGDVLWTHDGKAVVDPTIVEKPPEITGDAQG